MNTQPQASVRKRRQTHGFVWTYLQFVYYLFLFGKYNTTIETTLGLIWCNLTPFAILENTKFLAGMLMKFKKQGLSLIQRVILVYVYIYVYIVIVVCTLYVHMYYHTRKPSNLHARVDMHSGRLFVLWGHSCWNKCMNLSIYIIYIYTKNPYFSDILHRSSNTSCINFSASQPCKT